MSESKRVQSITAIAANLDVESVIDLGCGDCSILAEVERVCRIPPLTALGIDKDDTLLPGMFTERRTIDNAANVGLSGFDLVLACGLWRYLTLDEQLLIASRCRGRLAIIDTHFATYDEEISHFDSGVKVFSGKMSPRDRFIPLITSLSDQFPHHQMLATTPSVAPDRNTFLFVPK